LISIRYGSMLEVRARFGVHSLETGWGSTFFPVPMVLFMPQTSAMVRTRSVSGISTA
jgi:hypothetical protein